MLRLKLTTCWLTISNFSEMNFGEARQTVRFPFF